MWLTLLKPLQLSIYNVQIEYYDQLTCFRAGLLCVQRNTYIEPKYNLSIKDT